MSPASEGRPCDQPVPHGARLLPGLSVVDYSLALTDAEGLVGDRASQTAFREIVARWHEALAKAGEGGLTEVDFESISKRELDALAVQGDTDVQRAIAAAVEEFAGELAQVVERFARHPTWQGVRRVRVGGGFKESGLGRLALRLAERRLKQRGTVMALEALRHHADDAGLVGWVHALPTSATVAGVRFLAVDLGGTNVRCGIVEPETSRGNEQRLDARVVAHRKWRHADDSPAQKGLVEGVAAMLRELALEAQGRGWNLGPWIGLGCPGVIEPDGTIMSGAQNLPGDWGRPGFHLPSLLEARVRSAGGAPCRVMIHNDAVIQGLSECPSMQSERAWAVLTIGTGLGNASFRAAGETGGPLI